jgi:hypothetical protein
MRVHNGSIRGSWFAGECARHPIGNWWAFLVNPVEAVNGCPLGYWIQGNSEAILNQCRRPDVTDTHHALAARAA